MTAVDEAVGEVLAGLESSGLAARTLVVVVGDHGEEFWEDGGLEHGRTVYDEVARVPLLMCWPTHLPAGGRVGPVVRITDVTPTILDLVGVPTPPRRDGETQLSAPSANVTYSGLPTPPALQSWRNRYSVVRLMVRRMLCSAADHCAEG